MESFQIIILVITLCKILLFYKLTKLIISKLSISYSIKENFSWVDFIV